MIPKDVLKEIILKPKPAKKRIIERDFELPETNRITVATGVRRSGKSTLLRQKLNERETLFVNFEDPRLGMFEVEDFYRIEEIGNESGKKQFVFDEVQNVKGWERYARHAHDRGKKLFITGSNSEMLSSELGSKLTGRHKRIEVYPFSYREYLRFRRAKAGSKSFLKYLEEGGFPEYLAERDEEYLQQLMRDIVLRDITARKGIRNEQQLIELAVYLMSSTGKSISYNNITKTLGIKSVRTTIDFCDYLRQSYLIDLTGAYSFSVRKRMGREKKVYAIDTALARANSISATEDRGRMLENAVFLELKRRGKEVWFYKGNRECDFLIVEKGKPREAIQAAWELNRENTERELEGLREAMEKHGIKKGTILTVSQNDRTGSIRIVPAWEWFLEKGTRERK